ncbi:MAG: outer membrane protein assembly factor BamD [Candidatus Latescibacterota bacterium]
MKRAKTETARRIVSAVFILILMSCAGGMPSIPKQPEALLQKGIDHFDRGKYFQAQELFKAFLSTYPGHDRGDYAQFMLAESYFKDDEYPLATVEYRIVISDYSYSEYVDDAFLGEAKCFYEQAPKSQLDQSRSFEALSRLRQFAITFATSPLMEEANGYIFKIHEKLAEKDLKNARFYLRRKVNRSAKIYLDKVISDYPGNDFWATAMYYRGMLFVEDGDTASAAGMFEKVVNYPKELDITGEAKVELERLRRG